MVKLAAFTDMHVHLREPGYTHKETILSGSAAAYAGGFSHILCMPNTNPIIDTPDLVRWIKNQKAFVKILPIAAITIAQKGETLTDFAKLKYAGAVALSDDGVPVENASIMEKALIKASEEDILIISHCEDKSKVPFPAAEFTAIERDCALALDTKARLHIAHISTRQSVEIIRKYKNKGANITCETCPHYVSLTQNSYDEIGANAKMNPPLRSADDVSAIIEGIKDGTIDVISTDHAPHSIAEKNSPNPPCGIIGLETSFAVSYTYLVKTGYISLEKLSDLMSKNPNKILNINNTGTIYADINTPFIYDVNTSCSLSRNSPYDKIKLYGRISHVNE